MKYSPRPKRSLAARRTRVSASQTAGRCPLLQNLGLQGFSESRLQVSSPCTTGKSMQETVHLCSTLPNFISPTFYYFLFCFISFCFYCSLFNLQEFSSILTLTQCFFAVVVFLFVFMDVIYSLSCLEILIIVLLKFTSLYCMDFKHISFSVYFRLLLQVNAFPLWIWW